MVYQLVTTPLHAGRSDSWAVGQDAVLCSDGDDAYDLFARARALPHYRLNPNTGPKVIRTAFHLQTVNNLHSRFESFMKPFCGPATKYLSGYAAWFISRRWTIFFAEKSIT
jgi:hypothetical protein